MELASGQANLDIARVWAAAMALEAEAFELDDSDPRSASQRLSRAAELFERVGEAEGGSSEGYWRAARATWVVGEFLPLEASEERIKSFQDALALADRGLAANPECAECMLWKFTSMGRLRTTIGAWRGIRQVPEMAELLDRAIALQPSYRDNENNSTLGNLHYTSAIFYRIVPESFWLRLILGVAGDKERALRHSRRALALHPKRLDYRIEVGTQLVCLGSARNDDERLEQGLAILRKAVTRPATSFDEQREIRFVNIMLEHPEKACGYSGDKMLEMDEKAARRASM